MKDSINILCATDDNYVPYMGIMLTSLFENNKDEDIHVFILTEGLLANNVIRLQLLADNYKQKIFIVEINSEALAKCPIRFGDHVSIATYYRLFAAEILPNDIDRIIYLDGDIIVNGSLRTLWQYNLEGNIVGAVIDENYQDSRVYERLKCNPNNKYYNAGVLLLDIKKWREQNVTEECVSCIETRGDDLKFHDQDTLNIVQNGKIIGLPITFNMQLFFLHIISVYPSKMSEEIRKYCLSPIIIHYDGPNKPWQEGNRHPYAPYFLYYKSISLWKDLPLIKPKCSMWERFIQFRNEIIWRLGIMKRPVSYIIPVQYHPNDKHNSNKLPH